MTIAFQGMQDYYNQFDSGIKKIKSEQVLDTSIFDNIGIDKFEHKSKNKETETTSKIGFANLLFNRLTKEQIEEINKTGKLPKNAKFVDYMGKVYITWNLADITTGTHELPKGYEIKNDILGFTHVVREGTKNLFIK